ncbi:hypothetical protein CY34DRAFT_14287 [Suillus luteus UH-Slu-Lm8-n1]|uniref:Uncharacterized protein n=1 Tax=Suillus luteus UH-Slu-Lm8-n1 TaxID=930992 RepID=A0A0D0ANN9_9AGAM|nr:hypothetical protein CY34DRAFT_14287 [Suillus luteus UH-Slu-Lm8-n1]
MLPEQIIIIRSTSYTDSIFSHGSPSHGLSAEKSLYTFNLHHNASASTLPPLLSFSRSLANSVDHRIVYVGGDQSIDELCSRTVTTACLALRRSAYVFEDLLGSYWYSLQRKGKVPSP